MVGGALLSRQHRSRHPPGTIAVTAPVQTGTQPAIGRTSQNFTHPGTDGPLIRQSTSHSLGKNGPGLPSGQVGPSDGSGFAGGLLLGTLVGNSPGGTTGVGAGLDGGSTGRRIGVFGSFDAGGITGLDVIAGAIEGTLTGGTAGACVGLDSTAGGIVGRFVGVLVGTLVGFVGDFGRSVGSSVTGCIVTVIGDDVGCKVFGVFVGGGTTGRGGVAGAIVGTLKGGSTGACVGLDVSATGGKAGRAVG